MDQSRAAEARNHERFGVELNLKHRALGSQGVAQLKNRVTRLAEFREFL
jgi:hypothetical protein